MAHVGFGSARITPSLPVTLAGFGERKGAVNEIHDELEAHAIVIKDGQFTLCLLVMDLLVMGQPVALAIREEVAEALKTSVANVMTSCTHTHSGPSVDKQSKLIGWPSPKGYLDVLVEGCVRAARMADAFCEPAEFRWARAPLPDGLAVNRRGYDFNPTYSVLEARRPEGSLIGALANVAIHAVANAPTARAVSGDWPTQFRIAASETLDAPVVLLSGAIGDVNPARSPHIDAEPDGNWDYTRELGQDVANAVVSLARTATPIGDTARVIAHRTPKVRAGVTIPTVLTRDAFRRTTVELLEWQLGDVRMVSMPGEIFHDLGCRIEAARGDRAMVAAIAPYWQGYVPCPFMKGYEEKMSYGKGFVAQLDALLTAAPTG